MSANYYASSNYDVLADRHVASECRRWVNRVHKIETCFVNLLGQPPPHAVVADCDHDAFTTCLLGHGGQSGDGAEHRHTIDSPAVNIRVVIKESDHFIVPGLLEDVENDSAMSAGPQDEDAFATIVSADGGHVYAIGSRGRVNEVGCRVTRGATATPADSRRPNMAPSLTRSNASWLSSRGWLTGFPASLPPRTRR